MAAALDLVHDVRVLEASIDSVTQPLCHGFAELSSKHSTSQSQLLSYFGPAARDTIATAIAHFGRENAVVRALQNSRWNLSVPKLLELFGAPALISARFIIALEQALKRTTWSWDDAYQAFLTARSNRQLNKSPPSKRVSLANTPPASVSTPPRQATPEQTSSGEEALGCGSKENPESLVAGMENPKALPDLGSDHVQESHVDNEPDRGEIAEEHDVENGRRAIEPLDEEFSAFGPKDEEILSDGDTLHFGGGDNFSDSEAEFTSTPWQPNSPSNKWPFPPRRNFKIQAASSLMRLVWAYVDQ
ncbi:hypothetical protein BC567DRAFT_277684 [Phyllosticta citribraziliensis]